MNATQLKESYGTLSETINGLIAVGYIHDFNIQEDCIICHQTNENLSPEEFQIDKVYRFEGDSNPDDQSILYAISCVKHQLKGTLVNGYGLSSDYNTSKIIERLETNSKTRPLSQEFKEPAPQVNQPEEIQGANSSLKKMNLPQFINQLKSEKKWIEGDRNSVAVFKSDSMRIMLMGFHAGAELKDHKANGVISVHVLQGQIKFSTEQETVVLEQGQMIALQDNIIHKVLALNESFFLLTLAMNSK